MNSSRFSLKPVLKPCAYAVALALAGMASINVSAQTAPAPAPAPAVKAEKIEVTGSSIKRIEGESALPVQVITREDIEKSGSTTVAELLTKISASSANLTDAASFSDIAGQRGFNGANLRGIGVSSTLVLLNGRRLANFASPGGASGVDLNSIPSAALERVEILKDGASAVYGTDAISGVINFITRRDYQGADLSAYASTTKDGGAGKKIYSLSGGYGDLTKDRFNVFGVFDFQTNEGLRSIQRPGIGGSFIPSIGLDVASSNTNPANFRRTTASGNPTGSRFNPSAPNCNPPATLFDPNSFVGPRACYYDYMQDTEIFPEVDRKSFLGRAQFALTATDTLFAEFTETRTSTLYRISPATVTNLNYPAGGRFYPTATAALVPTTGPLRVNWRLSDAGPRTNDVDSTSTRMLIGAKGVVWGWDYDTAFNLSRSEVSDQYVDGYVNGPAFDAAFRTGNINPFGPQDAAGQALINGTKIVDNARYSSGNTKSFDLRGSRSLFALGGGDAALAVGIEARKEDMQFDPSELLRTGQIRSEGTAVQFRGSREVNAGFAEMVLPLTRQIEVQLALRHDRYNDVGSTTNPKVGIRWNPMKDLLIRGSYGTGFRAPSLADLYSPTRIGQTNGIYNDPLGCRVVGNIDNRTNPDYCGIQPDKLRGGSLNLKPEESKQYTLGIVFEPGRMFTSQVDYWSIEKTNTISSPEGVYFSDVAFYAPFITRAAADPTLPGIPGRITQIDSRLRNLGTLRTSGFDVGFGVRLPATSFGKFSFNYDGTYVLKYEVQDGPGRPYVSAVGRFANDQVVQRYRHVASFGYDMGPFSATLQQTYYRGYVDQQRNPDGSIRRVEDYQLWDLSGAYRGIKNLTVRAGIKNLADKMPPRSNQLYSFLAGYDANYTDPRGRTYTLSLGYSFK
jgi:iron complex outermembrane recepter protein